MSVPTQARGTCRRRRRGCRRRCPGRNRVPCTRAPRPHQQVEEAPQAVLHVVGEGVALRPRVVRLPESGAALVARALPAGEVLQGQGQPVLVDDRDEAVRAAGDAEGLQGFLVPDEPAVHGRPALDDGGQPAVGELRPLPGHDHEERSRPVGEAQALQVGDGGDDDGAGVGDGVLDLALPLAREVRWAEDEDPAEAGHVGGGGRDEGLARAHLAHHGRAAVGVEGEGGGADGVGLRPQRRTQQCRERPPVLGGPVAGRIGLHHPLGDGVAVGVDELCEVHGVSPSLLAGTTPGPGRTAPTPVREGTLSARAMETSPLRWLVRSPRLLRGASFADRR